MNTLIQGRHNHYVSQIKCLEERKKIRFTLQMIDLVLHSLVRIRDIFSEEMFVMILE